jgi:hypothetical protein
MPAPKQVERHAVQIKANRLLIQQMIIQMRTLKPKFIEEIYDRISTELSSHEAKSKRQRAFDAKVDAHVAELLSGAQQRDRTA